MFQETISFPASDGTILNAILWQPKSQPKAILQVTHGMTEHMGRYQDFAAALTSQGILVAGFDLRGHGGNPGDASCASMGKGGWEASIRDMQYFRLELDRQFPGLPHYMLGFSLGSFLLRDFLGQYPSGISGAIIAGSGQQPSPVLSIMMAIVKTQVKKSGFDQTTDLVKQLSFGVYNSKFKPSRTEADWLCSDSRQLDAYLADPLCRKHISSGLFYDLLDSMRRTGSPNSYVSWDKALPVLLLSGSADPVGDMGKGIGVIALSMKKAGMERVCSCLFPGARHDLFHEIENGTSQKLTDAILSWMNL